MLIKSVTMLGQKDHGKSTIIGNLLIQTKSILPGKINEAREHAKAGRFEPGYILDSFEEERAQDMTIDTARADVTYKRQVFTFIDVPGHEELIKNMISGASSGDVAILVISAKEGEGVENQTKRHVYIAKMLGIEKIIVAVNKIDLVGYSEAKFERIKKDVSGFIGKVGFEKANTYFIPVSGYNGENLTTKSKNIKWYTGKPLMGLIYELSYEEAKRGTGPLRIVAQGFMDKTGEVVVGNIVNGTLSKGEVVRIEPNGISISVSGIFVKGEAVKKAIKGENVALKFSKKVNGEIRGAVISGVRQSVIPKSKMRARIFLTEELKGRIKISLNGVETGCKSLKVRRHLDTTTGDKSIEEKAKPLNAIEANLTLSKLLPFESFSQTNELGRFVIYQNDRFAGIGIVEG